LNSYTNGEPADGEDEEYLIVIKDDGSDSDSEAEGSKADAEDLKLGTHFAFNAMVLSNDQQVIEMTVVIVMRSGHFCWKVSLMMTYLS
jgi:hypothetical protein